jgi:hypothetical protein
VQKECQKGKRRAIVGTQLGKPLHPLQPAAIGLRNAHDVATFNCARKKRQCRHKRQPMPPRHWPTLSPSWKYSWQQPLAASPPTYPGTGRNRLCNERVRNGTTLHGTEVNDSDYWKRWPAHTLNPCRLTAGPLLSAAWRPPSQQSLATSPPANPCAVRNQ